jgi:hypothetical protein
LAETGLCELFLPGVGHKLKSSSSVFCVAKITDVSPKCPAVNFFFIGEKKHNERDEKRVK